MLSLDEKENEQIVARAFSKQSVIFDTIYSQENVAIAYKRRRVRAHLQRFLKPSGSILELNAGTGEDAMYLARCGHKVHATDLSPGMLECLAAKVETNNLSDLVTYERCSFNALHKLQRQGPYDTIFSNFAGLNCTGKLQDVLNSFAPLLKPEGHVTLAILPKFCLWEFLLLFKGDFKKSLRRLRASNGAKAHIEGEYFRCWYYNPSFVIKCLQQQFDVVALEGLCSIVPPSYMEIVPNKYPNFYHRLTILEDTLKDRWPWTVAGDCYLITLRKRNNF